MNKTFEVLLSEKEANTLIGALEYQNRNDSWTDSEPRDLLILLLRSMIVYSNDQLNQEEE